MFYESFSKVYGHIHYYIVFQGDFFMRIFKLFLLLLIGTFILYPINSHVQAQSSIDVSANQAILMDQKSGRVIYEKDAHERRPVASITKVMTALLAIEFGQLNDEVSVSERATQIGGSSIYLQHNEKITLEDLLYGLMLRSGNDAAVAIAEHIAGSVEGFTFLMNEKALYLGMTNTSFMNPHGLDEDGHYSSAYDIALLMRHAMENNTFQHISNTKSYHSENRSYKWFNKNKLLTHLYENSTGGKTGFTKKAGRTLVSTAEKDDISLIVVTLQAPNDWNDHIHLFETHFNKLANVILEKEGKRAINVDDETVLFGTIDESVILSLADDEIPFVEKHVKVQRSLNSNEDTIGLLSIDVQGETVLTVPVYTYKNSVHYFFDQIKSLLLTVAGTDIDG